MRTSRLRQGLRLTICLALGVSAGLARGADDKVKPPLLLEQADLEKKLSEPKLRILDPRPKAEYDKGHIPGAVWVDTKPVSTLASRPGGLTDKTAWQAWITPLGIEPETQVIVVDGKRQLDAARLWWLLRHLGVENVGLVNGAYPLWVAGHRPVSTDVPKVKPHAFPVSFRPDWLATKDDVLTAIKDGSARVVDARTTAEYTGEDAKSRKGGHVPTACRVEWTDLVDKDGRFLDESTLRSKLAGLGLEGTAPAITHCQGGGRASVDAFVLRRLGIPARNYYLGWSDWGNAEETPVVKGTDPGSKP
ncbi:sulfurtransferase [Singulisphaera sp. PoT]|uniref:sulfurtransferase n=1 Tax=Singulisphaera sp. PoT TaxID=3411797 RepID=UPI003BF5011A